VKEVTDHWFLTKGGKCFLVQKERKFHIYIYIYIHIVLYFKGQSLPVPAKKVRGVEKA